VATIQDMGDFASGREFAAFLGLTPRQSSTGGKPRLGRITKMGDRYLRKLLVVGACSTLSHRQGHSDALRRWASGMLERKPRLQGVCRECGWSVCFNVSGLEELFLPAKMEIRAFRSS